MKLSALYATRMFITVMLYWTSSKKSGEDKKYTTQDNQDEPDDVLYMQLLRPIYICICIWPITMAARSTAWTVFVRSNAGIVGPNPTQGMDVCPCLFCICIGSGLVRGWSPIEGVLPTFLGLRNWSEKRGFTDALCPKVGATAKRERERERPVTYYPIIITILSTQLCSINSGFLTL
jgi:hypothetical protein